MVNAAKHRRKAIENEVRDFLEVMNGTAKNRINKKSDDLDFRVKPKLASGMNLNHFRKSLSYYNLKLYIHINLKILKI